jgi:hypothetical protein
VTARGYERAALEVDLPAAPTPGVLEWLAGPNSATPSQPVAALGIWHKAVPVSGQPGADPLHRATQMHALKSALQVPINRVMSWTPVALVPAAALDMLRAARQEADERVIPGIRTAEVDAFLAALDNATTLGRTA